MNIPQFSNDALLSKELIVSALSSSPAPTAIYFGEDMVIAFANEGMLALWGKSNSVIGMPLMDAIPELEGQPFLALLQQVRATGKTYSVSDAPARLVKNGVEVTDYFDYEYKPLLNASGETWCILNTALEVTARRDFLIRLQQKEEKEQTLKAEMAATLEELTSTNEELSESLRLLAQSREQIRTIITQAPVGIAMLHGPDHIIELANPTILKIWGCTESEVIGLPYMQARPELKGQRVDKWLAEAFNTGNPNIQNELTVKRYNKGEWREAIVNSMYQPISSPSGEVAGVLMILEDISEQVKARRKNEKIQHMFSMAIDAGELATFYYEPDTNAFSGNALLKSWFGLSGDELNDLSLALDVIVDEDRERVALAIANVLSENSNGHYLIEYSIKSEFDEKPRLVQARGKVFYGFDGKPQSLNGTLRDVTEQKKDEQRKADFMSMVSHELKTPLTSLKAYLQLLQRMAIMKENIGEQNTLEKSLRQVQAMNKMINGFLNVSRLDSGRMYLEKSQFDLATLISELDEATASTIHTHDIFFSTVPEGLAVFADREKISQVIHNLIGNAVKYSPIGSPIYINCPSHVNGKIKIAVFDKGIGIGKDDLEKIFERYYRVKTPAAGSIAGFGIGLYLCKEIITLHNGQISVDSNLGKGTTFSFILPAVAV